MMQNTTAQDSEKQVRRLMGEELALVRDTLRHGQPLAVATGETVWFVPLISFEAGSAAGQ